MFKKLLLVIVFSLSGNLASADQVLTSAFSGILQSARMRLENLGGKKVDSNSCKSYYDELAQDNLISITAAFGYMDVSSGIDYVYGDINYGKDLVVDAAAKEAFIDTLTQGCSRGLSACGFRKSSGNRLQKRIRRQNGQRVTVVVDLAHSSVGFSDTANRGSLASKQNNQSLLAEQKFFGGIAAGTDVSIYMGHARSGGGPDFSPPHLLRNGKPDYSKYRNQSAFKRLLGSVRTAGQNLKLLALLACNSTRLFVPSVLRQSPSTVVVSADDLFSYSDIVPTGLAVIDTVLSEKCDAEFSESLRIMPDSRSYLQMTARP